MNGNEPRLGDARPGAKPVIVLHIGCGKSGTSSVQSFLGKNRDRFAERGILIPNGKMVFGKGNGQQVFYFESIKPLADAGEVLTQRVEQAAARFGVDRLKAIIISAENLSNPHHLHETFSKLHESYDIWVVFYIRRQEDFYLSAWQQWFAKTGKPHSEWITKVPAGFGDWAAAIDRWDAISPERFIVRVYDKSRLEGGDVVRDFCAVLGLDTDNFELEAKAQNESFGVHVSSLYTDIASVFENVHDRRVETLLYDFGIRSAGKGRNETIFSAEELAYIRDSHADGNRRIKERFFPDIAGNSPFAALDHSTLVTLSQAEIDRRNLALLSELTFKFILKAREGKPAIVHQPPALSANATGGVQPKPKTKRFRGLRRIWQRLVGH